MEERLQKFLANQGICSRRKAEEYILAGKVKVNASTLYPYQIVREIISNRLHYSKYSNYSEHLKNQYQALWDNLPNYSTGDKNYLVVADVSGSMEDNGRLPMAVSVSMAIYMAQRNQGTFKNKYI